MNARRRRRYRRARPTNTGRRILAIERMLAHSSASSAALRLLAREVYNKCVDRGGAEAVALITGEEKISRITAVLGLHGGSDAARPRRLVPRRR